ncbi:MAG: polyprenyl synthetase family protein [Candidatus Eisenbacteria bacterium]
MTTRRRREFELGGYLLQRKVLVDEFLEAYLAAEGTHPEVLHEAMRYSVFSGGKRFRPILCMAGYDACGGKGRSIMPVACGIELIHTYSLIHDDLPCMDDDDVRRGKPTSHKVFGEAVAVLAGDALLTFAVELIVSEGLKVLEAERVVRVLDELMKSIGTDGMVAGQVVDMESEGADADAMTVEYIHSRKTGALICGAARSGAIVAGAEEALIERIGKYGERIGLAFQIVDDVMDAEGRFGELKSGSDLDSRKRKLTYPLVFGPEESRQKARDLVCEAKDYVADLGDRAVPLMALADLVVSRSS